MNFIKDHFDEYDASKYKDAWDIISVPQMIICQIGFWIYSYFFVVPEKNTSILWTIFDTLYYSFGGILYYIFFSVITAIISFILDKRKPGLIMLVIGIIGAILSFMRLYK